MRIKRIMVSKLFGIFDHDILLKDDGISIVIGENGLGKTVILEMMEAFFNNNYTYFSNVEFKSIKFQFDNNVIWKVEKEDVELKITQIEDERTKNFIIELDNNEEVAVAAHKVARRLSFMRKRQGSWFDLKNGEYLSDNDIVKRYLNGDYSDDIEEELKIILSNKPEWFIDIQNKIKIKLVKTQRLLSVEKKFDYSEVIPVVEKYSLDIKSKIKEKLAESSDLSSTLDRTYPKRLISYMDSNKDKIENNDILSKLKELEEKREKLSKVGLMDKGNESDILRNNDLKSETIKDVLMVYILDSFKKLKVFDDISPKIELLLNIINNRFKHKKLFINKENGFDFKSTVMKDENGEYKSIPVSKLSSGEQNELILFYELIFRAEEKSLILIDEPEISLHISWQNNFINDLKQINKLNKLNVLIATHSPDIIGENWDAKIELQGVE